MKNIIKFLYSRLPFKKQLFTLVKSIGIPSRAIYQHLHFKGIFNVDVENGKSFKIYHYGYVLENDIFWNGLFGRWEKVSMDIWLKLSKKANVVIDIGANTGIYSLVSKTINPNAEVYAFEPVERVYKKLVYNIKLNDYKINAFKYALSNYTGEALIYDTDEEHTYSVTVNKDMNAGTAISKKTKIQTKTLDDFIKEQDLKKIDLIKIDVESHEPEVLQGFLEHLFNFKPSIIIEILSDEIGNRVESIFSDSEYLFYNINEENGLSRVDHITHSDSYNYLLCTKEIANNLKI